MTFMLAAVGVTSSAGDDVSAWPLSLCVGVIDVYIWGSTAR